MEQVARRSISPMRLSSSSWLLGCLLLAVLTSLALGQREPSCSECAEWNTPQAPFRIFGNTYYVGTHGLSSVLITSPDGHVLIEGDLPESAPLIADNIRSLGFHLKDVKLIVNSHVHFDHAGGIAELQRRTGARVVASEWSAGVLKNGAVAKDDPQFGIIRRIAPVKNVSTFRDGEAIYVGDIAITPRLTPGHTSGGTSWTWKSCNGSECRDLVYADSVSPVSAAGFRFSDHPKIVENFGKSFAFFENVPCDVLITAHPDASDLWERLAQREKGVKPDPMVNSAACRELAAGGREKLKERLAREGTR